MNRFHSNGFKLKNKRSIIQVLVFLAIFVWTFYSVGAISGESSAQQKANLEQAVKKDMTLCYALEGFYPADVSYMEEHYGLIYDKNKYVIDYEYTGSNLMPSVLIIEK